MIIGLRHIYDGRVLEVSNVRGHMLKGLQTLAKEIKASAESTTSNWSNPAEFRITISYAGGDAVVYITTDNVLWEILNKGTPVRWAKMRSPYMAKTTPGVLGSTGGQRTSSGGYDTYIKGSTGMRRQHITPSPGIDARGWGDLLVEIYQPKLKKTVIDAIRKGMRSGTS